MRSSIKQRPVEKVMLIFPPVTIAPTSDKMCCMSTGIECLAAALRESYNARLLEAAVMTGGHAPQLPDPPVPERTGTSG